MAKNKIFFISCTENYPTAPSANNTKIGLLAKGLQEIGNEVTIINKYYGNTFHAERGVFEKLHYISLDTKQGKTLSSFINILHIGKILKKERSKENKNIAVFSCGSFFSSFSSNYMF